MQKKIVTRFAPSPTGYLHIGSARTALLNYIFTKKMSGLFKLRIEDTDKQRSTPKMTQKILDGLKWLGLIWDGEIVFQGAKASIHAKMAEQLIESDWAYFCFCTKEELEKNRSKSQYNQNCRSLSKTQVEEKTGSNQPYSVRFKIPPGETTWNDTIHGTITIRNNELEDFVILRSDGTPTYNLAVVVDDYDMGVNYIIRGDDHISNTPKQILMYHAFDWDIPSFAHVPLILGPDKKRLSKRYGARSIEEYKLAGYLPEAIFNYLAILSWSPKSDREIFTKEKIIEEFSLQAVSKKSAVFDEKKLLWMNQQYILNRNDSTLFKEITSRWVSNRLITKEEINSKSKEFSKIINLLKIRSSTMNDFISLATYFFKDPQEYEENGVNKYLKDPEVWELIDMLRKKLTNLEYFNQESIEELIRNISESKGVTAAKIIHPTRLALTGRTTSPGLFEVMELLGKGTVLRRLDNLKNKKIHLQQSMPIGQE